MVEMATPEAGYLAELHVRRGQAIGAGSPLFKLDSEPSHQDLIASAKRREAAEAREKDAELGEREEMIQQLEAQLIADRAAYDYATKEFDRLSILARSRAVAQEQLDRVQSEEIKAAQQIVASEAKLKLAKKGQRPLQVAALNAESAAQKALEETSAWRADQLERVAPEASIIQETLFEPGEWVPAGRPVVVLRRLKDLRARFFVAPDVAADLKLGEEVKVRLPGDAGLVSAKIVRVADQAEYTPPVIYSREQSERLVMMIEAQLPEEMAVKLHPGLPVTVELGETPP